MRNNDTELTVNTRNTSNNQEGSVDSVQEMFNRMMDQLTGMNNKLTAHEQQLLLCKVNWLVLGVERVPVIELLMCMWVLGKLRIKIGSLEE